MNKVSVLGTSLISIHITSQPINRTHYPEKGRHSPIRVVGHIFRRVYRHDFKVPDKFHFFPFQLI